jgi:hypothetical protein
VLKLVKDEIVNAIKAADRQAINQGYRHEFTINLNDVEKNIKEVCRRVLKDNSLTVPDRDLARIITTHVRSKFTGVQHQIEYSKLAGGETARKLSYFSSNNSLQINFPMDGYGNKHTLTSGAKSTFTTNQAAMGAMQGTVINDVRKDINDLIGSGLSGSQMQQGYKADKKKGRPGIRLSALHGTKSNRTTVAAFGGAEKMKENASERHNAIEEAQFTQAINAGHNINNLYDKVYKEYSKAFLTEVGLEQYLDMSIEDMRKNLKVQITFDPANKNATMKDYDSKELQKFISNYESKVIKTLSNQLTDEEMKSSPSPKQHLTAAAGKIVIEKLLGFPHKINPDMRLKVNKKMLSDAKRIKRKQRAKISSKQGKVRTKHTARKGVKKTSGYGRGMGHVEKKAGVNPMALRNLLNEMLPVAVAQNMGSPALNFRTGRLANSVRVDNVTQGPRGGNTMIEATYMNNPYETFAPGGKMYTTQRNPEKLIRKSIRQVASGLIGARFGINIQ